MKKAFLPFLILALFQISSCKKILLTSYGVKKPKVESQKSLEKFLKKKDLFEGDQFAFTFDGWKENINDIGLPGVRVFDKSGNYIPFPGEDQCKGGSNEFIEILKYPLEFPTTDSLRINEMFSQLAYLDGTLMDENLSTNADFVIVIFWAKFVGKLNSRDIKEWKNNISNNKNSTFNIVMVNCDMQESWGEENISQLNIK